MFAYFDSISLLLFHKKGFAFFFPNSSLPLGFGALGRLTLSFKLFALYNVCILLLLLTYSKVYLPRSTRTCLSCSGRFVPILYQSGLKRQHSFNAFECIRFIRFRLRVASSFQLRLIKLIKLQPFCFVVIELKIRISENTF